MDVTRRDFGRMAVSGLTSAAALLAARAKKIPLAVQVYSVRTMAAKDTAGVLARIAKLGYQGVEFAGYYDHTAQEIRKMLDDNRLKVAGTHIQGAPDSLLGDNLPKTLEYNKIIGNENLIVPGLPRKYTSSVAAWKETAKMFDDISAKVGPQGFVLGYHNHSEEFKKIDDQMPFDVFFGAANKNVKVQFDAAKEMPVDRVELIKRYRGRIVSAHIAPTGAPTVDWPNVLKALAASPGVEWFIVEEEGKSCVEYGCLESSIASLHKWGW